DSPAHLIKPTIVSKQNETFQQKGNVFTEKSRVSEEKVSNEVLSFNGSVASLDHSVSGFNGGSAEVLLKGHTFFSKLFFNFMFYFLSLLFQLFLLVIQSLLHILN